MSLTTTPQVLTSQNSSLSYHSLFEFRLRSETSTEAIYDLYNYATSDWHAVAGRHGIKVTFSTNSWDDAGTLDPTSVDPNGLLMDVKVGSDVRYQFTKPTTASWISSGGGTSTEGVSVANGSITIDAFGALYFRVDKSSPFTVNVYDYGIYLDGSFVGTIYHSSSLVDAVGYQNNPSDGLWQLSYQGGSSVQVLASYTMGRNKKVHANFW